MSFGAPAAFVVWGIDLNALFMSATVYRSAIMPLMWFPASDNKAAATASSDQAAASACRAIYWNAGSKANSHSITKSA